MRAALSSSPAAASARAASACRSRACQARWAARAASASAAASWRARSRSRRAASASATCSAARARSASRSPTSTLSWRCSRWTSGVAVGPPWRAAVSSSPSWTMSRSSSSHIGRRSTPADRCPHRAPSSAMRHRALSTTPTGSAIAPLLRPNNVVQVPHRFTPSLPDSRGLRSSCKKVSERTGKRRRTTAAQGRRGPRRHPDTGRVLTEAAASS